MIPIKDSQRSYSTPYITGLLIALNVFIFLYQVTLDDFTATNFIYTFALIPERFTWFNVVTSMFLHGHWMHLIGNMLFLWVFGDNIEDILGHSKFLFFYLLCGAGAALLQYAIHPDSRIPMIGASGAIFGVMGAYAVKFPHARIVMVFWAILVFTFELPAWLVMLYYVGLNFMQSLGSVAQVTADRGGTAFFAHLGGFFCGLFLILVMKTRDRYRNRRDLLW